MKKIRRRDFIKSSATGALLLISNSFLHSSCASIERVITKAFASKDKPLWPPLEPVSSSIRSVLTMVTHTKSVNGNGKINPPVIRTMMDEGMRTLLQKTSVPEAWEAIFPELKTTTTVGIKISTINSLAIPPEFTKIITENLIQIGIRPNNIIIWDTLYGPIVGLKKRGYIPNNSSEGVRCLATHDENIGYDQTTLLSIPSVGLISPLSKIVSQMCDYQISVSTLSEHVRAGVTGAMKTYYSSIPLGGLPLLAKDKEAEEKMHRHFCNPQIAELYSNSAIKDKVCLNICYALLGIYDGGPYGKPQFIQNQIFMSRDPVAVDYYSAMVIEEKRKEKGLPSILAKAKYIQTAAEMGLGTNNPDQIELRQIKLG